MTIALGIDTGGTYTDAVLVELANDQSHVIAGAKALTTRRDLAIGIGNAVEAVFADQAIHPDDVGLVALSTTLATNAIVEGQGSPIALLLIGYDPELIRQFGFEKDLVTQDVVYLAGGHDVVGDEVRPLDEDGVRQAILARRGQVEAIAVSSYFSVRNPAHELRVRELVAELTGADGNPVPVTCGHELTTRLNSVRRATTAALNARLIPLLQELIATVRQALFAMGIHAPLMVVKGDGSLVRSEWALRRPIETILSGPAASVVGAWYLAGQQDIWVVDVGGTTTDIAALRDGRPRLNPEGASVGRWRTMVEAVDVHTVGLGGDSHVRVRDGRQITIGPRRVVPLCLLASEHPAVVDQLRAQVQNHPNPDEAGLFVLRNRQPNRDLTADEMRLLAALDGGPQSLQRLTGTMRYGLLVRQQVDRLTGERLVLQAGFTPTDALHCLGRFQRWNGDAARLGAKLLASQAGVDPEEFCEQVVAGVPARVAQELVTKVLNDEAVRPHWADEPGASALLARALGTVPDSELSCRLTLRRPVVAIGAPVAAYFPRVEELLNTEIIIPHHAEVANAVGAVVGGVMQQLRVTIHPIDDPAGFRVHLFDGVHDFPTLAEAIGYAERIVPPHLQALAREAGASQVEVKMVRHDLSAPVRGGWAEEIFIESELTFTAVGRPAIARD
jgi:N-methylhydantoinase A/oxoprolinase/acetone carboxylase beta subunit